MASSEQGSYEGSLRGSEEGDMEEMDDYSPNEYEPQEVEKPSNHALTLEWCIGFNFKLINGVINLVNDDRDQIFFVSGNTGVIYDFKKADKKQRLLQGHCNEITCVAYCEQRDIIVTADKGPSSLMVIWDVKTATPRHTIFDPHPNGVESLDITDDGSTIVTLSLEEEEPKEERRNVQTVKIWSYQSDEYGTENYREVRSARIDKVIPEKDNKVYYQKFVSINKWKDPMDEFATTGIDRVYFWKVDKSKDFSLKGYAPPNNSIHKAEKRDNKKEKPKKKTDTGKVQKDRSSKKDQDEDRNSGSQRCYSQTVFTPCDLNSRSSQALTGTNDGHVIVWDTSLILEETADADQKREISAIPLIEGANKKDKMKYGISVIISQKNVLIIGTTAGHVRFFDYQFLLLSWFESDKISEVTSISVCNRYFDYTKLQVNLKAKNEPFDYPNFIVVDRDAKIFEINVLKYNENMSSNDISLKKSGDDSKKEEIIDTGKKMILQSIPGRVNSISSKPKVKPDQSHDQGKEKKIEENSQIAISCENGSIYIWDFAKKESQLTKLEQFQSSPGEKPSCLQYSPNAQHLIVATNQRNIHCYKVIGRKWQKNILQLSQKKTVRGLYITFAENSEYFAVMDDQSCVSIYKLDEGDWMFNGRLKSHHTEVNDLCFVEILNQSQELRQMLYSIGEDKYMVEYDVKDSRVDRLAYSEPTKIEHEIAPTACIWYPVNHLKEPILLVATEDYKLKLWNVKGNKKICLATYLGPTYGRPINKMIHLKRQDDDTSRYVAYSTSEKIAGVIKLPLDGNPNKTMGMIVHPGRISSMTATSDGRFLFTCGYDEIGVINMWYVNYAAIDEQEKMVEAGQNPLDIYPNLLEGGKDGLIYRDLKDFFYYAQINSNTDKPTKAKKLDGKIPYTEVPQMMRALGYYPTKLESQNMMNEVLYSKRHLSDKLEESLELDTFVKLFINHRPVYGLTTNLIKEKVNDLRKTHDGDQIRFDRYSREDFITDITTRGEKFTLENLKEYISVLYGDGDPKSILPEFIDADFLIEKLLGMEDENEEEPADFVPDHSN